jgi:4-hydroxybenzoate polyprenyltransferase
MPDQNDVPPLWLSWLRLLRIPNVFTAFADVAMGYAVVMQGNVVALPLVLLCLASGCLYSAGMVLNDVFDIEQDRRERPNRPLPSGRISLAVARAVGFGLLATGVVLGGLTGYLSSVSAAVPWRAGVVAALVAASVVLYDAALKRFTIGPLFMGLCRFFNVLLGMSVATAGSRISLDRPAALYYTEGQILVAAAIGVYVLGITLFARREAHAGHRATLVRGTVVMAVGILTLLWIDGKVPTGQELPLHRGLLWPALLVVLAATIGRHCVNAIVDPQPRRIQTAVKFAILCIITLDAAVTLWAAGPFAALAVFLLVVPMMAAGWFVYST